MNAQTTMTAARAAQVDTGIVADLATEAVCATYGAAGDSYRAWQTSVRWTPLFAAAAMKSAVTAALVSIGRADLPAAEAQGLRDRLTAAIGDATAAAGLTVGEWLALDDRALVAAEHRTVIG